MGSTLGTPRHISYAVIAGDAARIRTVALVCIVSHIIVVLIAAIEARRHAAVPIVIVAEEVVVCSVTTAVSQPGHHTSCIAWGYVSCGDHFSRRMAIIITIVNFNIEVNPREFQNNGLLNVAGGVTS